jgi:tetratricopeptide (TPR) repeat protein
VSSFRFESASAGCLLAALVSGALGCGPRPEAPLPPETDLHAYSLAVAERTFRKCPTEKGKALFHVGRVEERFGLEDKALELYRQALDLAPDLADAHVRTGFILSLRKDRMQEAIQAYQQALRLNPGMEGVHTRLGLVYMHLNRLDDALRALEEEVRAATSDDETFYNLGQVLALQGKHAEAAEKYRQAIEKNPRHRSAHYSLAQSLRVLGKKDEEQAAMEKFQELKKKEDAYDAARPKIKDDLPKNRQFTSQTWMDTAEILIAEGNKATDPEVRSSFHKESIVAIEEAVRFDPESVEPRTVIIQYYKGLRDFDRAVRTTEESLRAIPGQPELARVALQLASECATEAADGGPGRFDYAYRLLRTVAETVPGSADAHRELAWLILKRLRREQPELLVQAIEHAEQAVARNPHPRNYDVLAYAYFESGKPGKARKALEEGLARNPGDEDLRKRLEKMTELAPPQ